jgi:DNA-binding NarL/FixJ family response regulator
MNPARDVWKTVHGGDLPPGRARRHSWPHPRWYRGADADPVRLVERLTCRQREVLALMASGWSNGAIARQLQISEKAVVQHTSQIYDRLDLLADDETHRRVHAVLRYLAHAAAA